jgi:hypothetical protein
MSSVVISGDTSGTVTLAAPAVAGSTTLTLPSTSGTVLTTATGQTLTSPILITPDLGTPTNLVGTNISGTSNSFNAGLGVNQTWQSVTRTSGTPYTNSTGKPIVLLRSFTVTTTNVAASSTISINSGTAMTFVYVFSSVGNPSPTGNIIIPSGATYVVTDTNASSVVSFELR